jgi:hypothetical protein
MSFRLLIGIPSYNEADTIGTVLRDVDEALLQLGSPADTLIVNADNSSQDGTPEQFMTVLTRARKHVINTPRGAGKGRNVQALFQLALEWRANAVLLLDADLAWVPKTWISGLVEPVRAGAAAAFPRRAPAWNGGDLTYHLAYPLLNGIFGAAIHEPLCGEVCFSREAVQRILANEWTPDAHRFGIDFLMASTVAEMDWCEVFLSEPRRHKFRSFNSGNDLPVNMGSKFVEVARSALHCSLRRLERGAPAELRTDMSSAGRSFSSPPVCPDDELEQLAELNARQLKLLLNHPARLPSRLRNRLIECCAPSFRSVSWDVWEEVLIEWLKAIKWKRPPMSDMRALETIFLARVVGHYSEILGKSDWYDTVESTAMKMFERRAVLHAQLASSE